MVGLREPGWFEKTCFNINIKKYLRGALFRADIALKASHTLLDPGLIRGSSVL